MDNTNSSKKENSVEEPTPNLPDVINHKVAHFRGRLNFLGAIFVPYVIIMFFVMLPGLLSSSLMRDYPGITFLSEVTQALPMMLVGYIFGMLGGVTRTASEYGYFFYTPDVEKSSPVAFVAGVLGMMTYLALNSGFVLKLIYPDATLPDGHQLKFPGLAISAFIVGFFATETVLFGKSRIARAIRDIEKEAK